MGTEFVGAGLGVPDAHRRHRRRRARHPGARDRGGHPARSSARRPASGRCGRSSAAASTTTCSRPPTPRPPGSSRTRCAPRSSGGSRGSTSTTSRSRSTPSTAASSTSTSTTSIRGTNDPRNLVFPFYVIREHEPVDRELRDARSPIETEAADDGAARAQPRRPRLPGPRRRRQAPRAAALPRVDRPQRLRPRRHADRGVRADGRPADLPAQPGAGPALREVPRADRRPAVPADGGARDGDVLAVRGAAGDRAGARRDRGGDAAHRHRRPGRLQHHRRPRRSCPASSPPWPPAPAGGDAQRPHAVDRGRAAGAGVRGPARRPATRCWSGLSVAVPSCAVLLRIDCPVGGVGHRPDASRRWRGRRGPAPGWSACEVDRDETGGLNRPGDVVLHVPADARGVADRAAAAAGWLRCRVTAGRRTPAYTQDARGSRRSAR